MLLHFSTKCIVFVCLVMHELTDPFFAGSLSDTSPAASSQRRQGFRAQVPCQPFFSFATPGNAC